jgi:hypothetical protein
MAGALARAAGTAGGVGVMTTVGTGGLREPILAKALRLEYLTVGWNMVEGVIAVTAAVVAGSVALMGFGIDSFVESASGSVLIWRLRAERRHASATLIEQIERRAQRLVALSLFALAAYIVGDAVYSLLMGDRPQPSTVGIILTSVSLAVMWWLAKAKLRAARALGSRALESDAFQTTACWWLSLAALGGIGLNAAFSWWWADPVAAIVISLLILREGREAWRGEDCCGVPVSPSPPPSLSDPPTGAWRRGAGWVAVGVTRGSWPPRSGFNVMTGSRSAEHPTRGWSPTPQP